VALLAACSVVPSVLDVTFLSAGSVDEDVASVDVPIDVMAASEGLPVEVVAPVEVPVEEVLVAAFAVSDSEFIHANGLTPLDEVAAVAALASSVDTPSFAAPVVAASLLF
jgi:hypothetical protein